MLLEGEAPAIRCSNLRDEVQAVLGLTTIRVERFEAGQDWALLAGHPPMRLRAWRTDWRLTEPFRKQLRNGNMTLALKGTSFCRFVSVQGVRPSIYFAGPTADLKQEPQFIKRLSGSSPFVLQPRPGDGCCNGGPAQKMERNRS